MLRVCQEWVRQRGEGALPRAWETGGAAGPELMVRIEGSVRAGAGRGSTASPELWAQPQCCQLLHPVTLLERLLPPGKVALPR